MIRHRPSGRGHPYLIEPDQSGGCVPLARPRRWPRDRAERDALADRLFRDSVFAARPAPIDEIAVYVREQAATHTDLFADPEVN